MTEAANTTAPVAELKEAKIVSPKERHIDVPLDWPIEFGDETFDAIRIRRVTGVEVDTFLRQVGALKDGDRSPQLPVIDCPAEVYEALDDDDRLRVEEASLPFMPRRLREAAGLTLPTVEPSFEK